jgi:hypothetical protein
LNDGAAVCLSRERYGLSGKRQLKGARRTVVEARMPPSLHQFCRKVCLQTPAQAELLLETPGTKKARRTELFYVFPDCATQSETGIWCPEEDSNLHTLSSTST